MENRPCDVLPSFSALEALRGRLNFEPQQAKKSAGDQKVTPLSTDAAVKKSTAQDLQTNNKDFSCDSDAAMEEAEYFEKETTVAYAEDLRSLNASLSTRSFAEGEPEGLTLLKKNTHRD